MQANRSASYAIRGYFYQFNKSIQEIINSDGLTNITLEGIEDIDVVSSENSNFIQCKYHSAQRFNPSTVYKPIGEMVKHHLNNPSDSIKYTLYAYFGENSPPDELWITHQFLIKSLQKIDPSKNPSEDELDKFLIKFKFLTGLKFEDLQVLVKEELRNLLNTSEDDVENYFYNNALSLIATISSKTIEAERRLNKNSFLAQVNQKTHLFDRWLRELKGKQAYIKFIRSRLKSTNSLSRVKRKFLFISQSLILSSERAFSLNQFLHSLIIDYPLEGKLYNTTLWTIVVEASKEHLNEVKTYLIQEKIYYNDGYECLSFCAKYFNIKPFIRRKNKTEKIEEISHQIRLISAETMAREKEAISVGENLPHIFIDTSDQERSFFSHNANVITYRLSGIKSLTDLSEILKEGNNNV